MANTIYFSRVNAAKENERFNQEALYTAEEKAFLIEAHKTGAYISLQPEFIVERFAENFNIKNYLTVTERKEYLIDEYSGQFYDADDYALDGKYIYCLLPNNKFYAAPIEQSKNHSHLVAGLPVLAAGDAYFKNGVLVTLSNNSGHYKPSLHQMRDGIAWFVENANSHFLFEDHSKISSEKKYFKLDHYRAEHLLAGERIEVLSLSEIEEFLEKTIDDLSSSDDQSFTKYRGDSLDSCSDKEPIAGYQEDALDSSSEEEAIPGYQQEALDFTMVDVNLSLAQEKQPEGHYTASILKYTGISREATHSRFRMAKKLM